VRAISLDFRRFYLNEKCSTLAPSSRGGARVLPKIILTLLQIHLAWAYGPQLKGLIPANLGRLDIFLLAVVISIVVFLVGHLGALVLKETPPPSNAKLVSILVFALIFAGLTLVPQVPAFVNTTLRLSLPVLAYPVIGAILGYQVKK
jgi:hypothetical protein